MTRNLMVALVTAWLVAMPVQAAEVVLTAAHVNPPGEASYEAFKFLAEKLDKSTTGVRLKVFPQGQVGSEQDALEQTKLAAITMTTVANSAFSNFAPAVGVFDIPFLFRDATEHPWKVVDGPIGKKIGEQASKESGFVVLGWWSAGQRHVFTRTKTVAVPADMKDVKIRVIGSPVYIDTFNGLGAKATAMPYGEVYTSLATGSIDAAENDTSGYRNMKFFEQAPNLSLTGHFFLYKPVLANAAALAKLSPEQRKEFDAAFAEATAYQRKKAAENFAADIDWLKKNTPVKVTQPDRAAFEKALTPVIAKYEQKYGKELVESIRNTR